jgi:hypothetical protein
MSCIPCSFRIFQTDGMLSKLITLHYGRYTTDFMMFASFTRCVRRLSPLVTLFHPLMSLFSSSRIPYQAYQESRALFLDRGLTNFRDRVSIFLSYNGFIVVYVQVHVGLARLYPVIN